MNVLKVLLEAIEGYRDGGVDEAVSDGVEEVAEEATGRDL